MKRKASATAKVIQILLWYDQPEILLLKRSRTEYILAVSSIEDVDNDKAGFRFIGASMNAKHIAEYQDGKFDLRYALSNGNLRKFWTFCYSPENSEVTLEQHKRTSKVIVESLPEAGFFARDHDRVEVVDEFVADAVETFDIDGDWDLGEFSKLYDRIEDVYYILNDIRRFKDPNISANDKETILDAFLRPWQGGGSYVGFYDRIANDNRPTARLKVGGIQYNSPGYVRIKAKRQPFDAMIDLLRSYAENPTCMSKSYNTLHKYLSTHSLLRAKPDTFISESVQEGIREYSIALSRNMNGVSFETILEMARDNVLVSAKVLLSLSRRLKSLYGFFEQGRVKYAGLDTDPLRYEQV